MTKIQRVFDIEEYANKARTALAKLKQNQQPGEKGGKGGKADVLQAVKSEIKALIAEGYTAKQIAEAFKDDVFGILPKTITEIAGDKSKKKAAPSVRKTHPRPAPPDKTTSSTLAGNNASNEPDNKSGSFAIKPDTDDL